MCSRTTLRLPAVGEGAMEDRGAGLALELLIRPEREVEGPERMGWSPDELLVVALIDLVARAPQNGAARRADGEPVSVGSGEGDVVRAAVKDDDVRLGAMGDLRPEPRARLADVHSLGEVPVVLGPGDELRARRDHCPELGGISASASGIVP